MKLFEELGRLIRDAMTAVWLGVLIVALVALV